MLIIAKPMVLVSLVTNPITGKVDMVLSEEAKSLLGPVYPMVLRQQLENATKIAKELEKTVSIQENSSIK
jgi:hypothetical protein